MKITKKELKHLINEMVEKVLDKMDVLNEDEMRGEFTEEFQQVSTNLQIEFLQKNELKPYVDDIWNILQESYKDIGGIKSFHSYNDFKRRLSFAKLVFENETLIACSVYRSIESSYKMIAIGCNQTKIGKIALQRIIQDDIKSFDMHFWAEVSGAIEHYFKKYNGYPMPNKLVDKILNIDIENIRLYPDQVHYERPIGVEREYYKKMIFGVKNEEMFQEAIRAVEDYGTFMQKVNQLPETVEFYTIKQAIYIIENIYRAHEEDGFNELIPSWYTALNRSLETLENVIEKNETVEEYIEYAEYLLDNMPLLTLNALSL